MIRINHQLNIPEEEVQISASRSSGPGGQHVNTASTKVTLRFDIPGSRALSPQQKDILLEKLGSRTTKEGVLLLHAESHRSQYRNRQEIFGRFRETLRRALAPKRVRKKSRPPKKAKERRLQTKKMQSEKKKMRQAPDRSS